MPLESRNPSGTRIAITLGALVAAVMLGVWGVAALAGTLNSELEPGPKVTPIASAPASATSEATVIASAAVASATPAKPVAKPIPPAKPVATPAPKPAPTVPTGKYVVVIDPGHQGSAYASKGKEPQQPGGPADYPKTHDGASSASGVRESTVVLKIGMKLKPLLEAQGVKVIMIRTSENVTISNKERAETANSAGAHLFLRLHCDGIDSSSANGISMQAPANSGWPAASYSRSKKANQLILASLIRATGAKNRGIVERSDLAGFNWCKVPVALPELGFLSNGTEAKRLASDDYQSQLARALADGTMSYLRASR